MKTLFIPAKVKANINKDKIKSLSKKLPKNIAIAYSIQYKDIASEIKSAISNNVTQITQVLGCSKPTFPKAEIYYYIKIHKDIPAEWIKETLRGIK